MSENIDDRKDPVDKQVRDLSPEEIAEWLIKYHHLPEESRSVVVSNLRTQFYWHEIRGRLWRGTLASVLSAVLMKWWRLRT